ncbi:MAG: hypothetical protein CMI06_02600 [Oceanospirillaceae bacterium]|nr:hypothetical protein [Oceanospirillaceae bacterium]
MRAIAPGLRRSSALLLSCALFTLSACTKTPDLPLGQELPVKGEEVLFKDISTLLTDHLKEQYANDNILRDTHPKDNGCIRGNLVVNEQIDERYRHGIFQPAASYPLWMRFSNSVEEITSDKEKDFRGLALKLTQVEGNRLPLPGDEQHSQDFLFLGHDAFFAANPQQFFDFFDANFNGKRLSFLLTHPRGAWNILRGAKVYNNPLNVKWNSVTPYALGLPLEGSDGVQTYPTVVRYALRTCSDNPGQMTDSDDYLAENLAEQLSKGSACLDFLIQLQKDPKDNPTENALISWDEDDSPFIPLARINIPPQSFTSEAQKQFCENISFNPWHSLEEHRPIGGINRARRLVMKDISDFRLQANGVERFEPTGHEVFE